MSIKEYINAIIIAQNTIEYSQAQIKSLNENISDAKKIIKSIVENNDDVKDFIISKLEESIENNHFNDGKDDNEYNESECSFSSISSDGGGQEGKQIIRSKNPNSKFIPSKDEWEIVDVKVNEKNEYKIKVENVKARKYINPWMWEPEWCETDWIKMLLW